jgi:hypothetical protein
VSEPLPLPKVQNPAAELDYVRQVVFDTAGEGFNRDGNPIWLDIQRAVDAMKQGKRDFSSARSQ